MWTNDDEAGVALRSLQDEPAPLPVTTLDQVLRRGRRRVRAQRLGMLAIVVAVVATAGVGMVWLRSADRVPPDPGTIMTATVNAWPERLPGWSEVAPRACGSRPAPRTGTGPAILPKSLVETAFVTIVGAASESRAELGRSDWRDDHGYAEVEIPVDRAKGSVALESAQGFTNPAVAADAEIDIYGTCMVTLRTTLASGAVLQLYAPDVRSPFAPIQHLRCYLPDGRMYVVSAAGWSRADDRGGVVRDGRGRLPLDSRQLADIATRVVALN